jgi:hypothetical protein
VVASVATLSLDVPTLSVQSVQLAGPPGIEYFEFPICYLSEFFDVFLYRLACPLNVELTIFLQSRVILHRLGRCTTYLHENTKSWKSRSLSF